jgi:predicted flap endonuclease-1-like 5' DNA nuclease
VGWLDDYLQFRGRIERDTWREQAAEFAKAK